MVFQTLAKNYISFKNTISSVYELQYALKAFLKGAEQNKLLEERHCDSHVYMTLDLRVFTVDQTNNVLFLSLLKIFSPEYFADREKSQFRYVCQKFIQQTLKNIQDQRDSQLETNTYTFKAWAVNIFSQHCLALSSEYFHTNIKLDIPPKSLLGIMPMVCMCLCHCTFIGFLYWGLKQGLTCGKYFTTKHSLPCLLLCWDRVISLRPCLNSVFQVILLSQLPKKPGS